MHGTHILHYINHAKIYMSLSEPRNRNMNIRPVEIMAPVGSFEALAAAIQAGAHSVYFGVGHLNMRSRSSKNFTPKDLEEITSLCRKHQVRTYLTLNTVVYDEELEIMQQTVDAAKKHMVSAIIASDMAVIQYARKNNVEVHMSTQTNITNIEAVKYYSQYAEVMVLARELSLHQIKYIARQVNEQNICGPSGNRVRLEAFVHGALCMAISGKCYLSLHLFGQPANRGQCLQPCRRAYEVTDKENMTTLEVDHEYIMSPKDLKTIQFLDEILNAGVSVLKIEGRGRSPEYVKTVVETYKEALDACLNHTFSDEKVKKWDEQLKKVYNRGFWEGYFLGKTPGEWTPKPGSQATKKKTYVGIVTNYFSKISVAEILIQTHKIVKGDDILIIGPTTGVQEVTAREVRVDLEDAKEAVKGETCSIKTNAKVRRQDKVYLITDADPNNHVDSRYEGKD